MIKWDIKKSNDLKEEYNKKPVCRFMNANNCNLCTFKVDCKDVLEYKFLETGRLK